MLLLLCEVQNILLDVVMSMVYGISDGECTMRQTLVSIHTLRKKKCESYTYNLN